jgi:hypothetical protein
MGRHEPIQVRQAAAQADAKSFGVGSGCQIGQVPLKFVL